MEFYNQLSQYYDIIFPLNKQSVDFIKEHLVDGPVLDLAAGTGNHALALARDGFQVTATDLDENMVVKIKEKAALDEVTIIALPLAMEELDQLKDKSFSTIICLGNSLVHLNSLESVKSVTTTIYDLLDQNGKLMIQIVNYDRVLNEGITELPLINREKEQISFRRIYKHEENKILFKGELTIGGETLENEISLLPITSQQLVDVLTSVGFSKINLFGSFKGEPFEINSPALIIEATKH
ncbi:class I SAM-dependent methyltransferase [Anaerobacillus isosaccharinicus]|uniref:Class I SAM-dependent methyltransferase n=1 Tax=Anaerobacillus isosaccharinicus TaxID=1532552 RepID=A0A1S2LMP5_9BACI|nr:class I SAM-dependent methyltransferase [Anaerobacillus isosaccharinicus]MBA5585126.1 class I SAM-dependent methyltransferase [Anaerobacillus isosaccharinicus]QOY36531.1 class I SAM-dependent methyltransferase [Anaerobacillus isosaccharinicus]